MDTAAEPRLVEKEDIPKLNFKKEDIVVEQAEGLEKKLAEAMRLGNGFRSKVKITFRDDEGLKQVVTTVWATGGNYVTLKGGVWIPVKRIVDLKFM